MVARRIEARYSKPYIAHASIGPTAAAIANALHHALGLRVRDLPLTPERVAAAM